MDINSLKKKSKADLIAVIEQLSQALKMERADAINMKNRYEKDQQAIRDQSKISLLVNLLPLIDNLHRAFGAVPEDLKDNNWVLGVVKINQQLDAYLSDLNIQSIDVLDKPFDPNLMEAVATLKDDTKTSQTVCEEVVKGYMYNDQILRIAQVKVIE